MIKRSFVFILAYLLISEFAISQELFVFSEPASNMPSRSVAFRITARYPDSKFNNYFKQRYMPEFMLGLNKNLMMHLSGTFSDYYSLKVRWESIRGYLKYRFLSKDGLHRHFRMAAFLEGSHSRGPFLYEELSLEGDNSGVQGGLIATQLVNKLALSGTFGYTRVFADRGEHTVHQGHSLNMLNYSISTGYLLFPNNYTDYHQTNVNLYLEILGGKCLDQNHYSIDIAPAFQLIFNSTTKINLGAKFQLSGSMTRVGENLYQISAEHTLLNVLGKKRRKSL